LDVAKADLVERNDENHLKTEDFEPDSYNSSLNILFSIIMSGQYILQSAIHAIYFITNFNYNQ
jgi:hypothetical protein